MSIKENEEEKLNYLLPNKSSNKKTLVLDLDETLVHSQFIPFNIKSDITLKIELENEMHDVFILVRPGLEQFLEKMGKIFEIVIFTASISSYADPLLDIIDKNNICKYRLYREHCTEINNCFIKEINKLGRELKDVIIVDNSPLSYYFNPENGIPISSWFDDKNDKELYNISVILEFLSFVPDVRNFIQKFVVNNQISYNNAINLFDKYNEILTKNQNKLINYPNNNFAVNNNKLLKKNNSKNKNKILIEQNKENINSNNININYNSNDIKNNIFSNYINIKKNTQKNSIKEININNIKHNYKKISNKNKIFQNQESKENINQNVYEMQTFSNTPMTEIFKKNQSTKNKYSKNINFNINPNIPELPLGNLNQNNVIKKGNNKICNYSNNQNINLNNEKIKHKKSDSVNLLRHHKKIIENKFNINKTNSLMHSSNIILNQKKKILNNLNKYKLINYQNSILAKKNKNHKFSIQLSMKNNTDLNNELENLDESKNNNKLSKSLNKDNFYKNHSCNKSTILKPPKNSYISKIYHMKNKSINNSLFGLSINFSKDENKISFQNSSKNKLKFKHKRFLSTSESYNNTLLKNRIIINNTNQASTLKNSTIHKPHFSQRKIKNLKELQILKTERNNNIYMYKEKKKMNKIPFKINNKRYSANENTLKIKIPINKNILYNIDKNYKNKIIQNIYNNNDNSLSSISLTARHKSLKQIAYERIITDNNETNKEGKKSLYELNNKKSFKERVNNNILKIANNSNYDNCKKKYININNIK